MVTVGAEASALAERERGQSLWVCIPAVRLLKRMNRLAVRRSVAWL
jgi:hypothetical protein